MAEYPDTRQSLLLQVKDPQNREAWEQFSSIYRPVIYRTAIGRGLQDSDAHDLAQQVLLAVASAIGRYEPSSDSSKFRHWLSRVTRNAILNALTRRRDDRATGGSSAQIRLNDVPHPDQVTEELIGLEHRRELYLVAADQVRDEVLSSTWQAFEMTVVQSVSIEQAAERLGKTVGAIYSCRSRGIFRVREKVKQLEKS
jgi:RNA polymerase sigma-70 factor (ECF subfamily)